MRPHPIATCSKTLAANASAHPLDVVKMKSALGALGHYAAPDWGVSQFPDAALFDAIKRFQKSQGLKTDGAIKPGGETEAALSQALTPRRATTALQATAQAIQKMGRGGDELLAHITREEAALLNRATDGASINPKTGLLEFSWDSGGTPQNDSTDDGDDFGWGPDDPSTDDGPATSSGNPTDDTPEEDDTSENGDSRDSHGQGRNSGNGQGGSGTSASLTEAKEQAGKAKGERGQRNRGASGRAQSHSLTDGLLDLNSDPNPNPNPDDEDALDWSPDLLGEPDPNTPTDPKEDPGSNGNGGGQNNSGKNSVVEAAVKEAKEKAKEAKARRDYLEKLSKSKGFDRFWLGTKYGYKDWTSPRKDDTDKTRDLIDSIFNETNNADRGADPNDLLTVEEKAKEAKARRDYLEKLSKSKGFDRFVLGTKYGYKDWTSVRKDDTAKTRDLIDSIFNETNNADHGDFVDPNALDDLNALFEAETKKTEKETRQRMAEMAKDRQRTKRAAEVLKGLRERTAFSQSQLRQEQAKQAAYPGYFSKNGVTFTDNWANPQIGGRTSATMRSKDGLLASPGQKPQSDLGPFANEFMGLTATGGPKAVTPYKDKPVDVESFAKWRDKFWLSDKEKKRIANEKALNVAEQPISTENPKTAGTLLNGFRTSTRAVRKNLVGQIESLMMRDPEGYSKISPEIKSYYEAYQMTMRGNPMGLYRLNYTPAEKEKLEARADRKGLGAATTHFRKNFFSPLAKTSAQALKGMDLISGQDDHAAYISALMDYIDFEPPTAYMSLPSFTEGMALGQKLAWGVDTFTPVGALTAGYGAAQTLKQYGMSKKAQRVGAAMVTLVNAIPVAKLGMKGVRPALKELYASRPALRELNTAVRHYLGPDLSKLSQKEMQDLTEFLADKGISVTADGMVKGVGSVFGENKPKTN